MSLLLSSIGLFIAMVGLATVGFAVPLRDFDLGHSLIIAGTMAIVGGLILFGLGAVVRELRRQGRAPERAAQPRAAAAAAAPTPAAVATPEPAGKTLGKMPLPTPAPPVVGARSRTEPRLDAPEPSSAQPQRPDIFATIRAGREPMPEAENVPLSPSLTPRATPRPDTEEPQFTERRPLSPAVLASRTAARIDTPRAEPARPSERPGRNLFDTVWPTEARRGPDPVREAPVPKMEPVAPPPPRMEERAPEPPHDDPAAAEPADLPAPTLEAEMAAEVARHVEPKPVSILKSGVIDGMAYTLYTDGSIEAQLPKGMMRFASIDELRQYLEQHS